jgi:hypothetical protein
VIDEREMERSVFISPGGFLPAGSETVSTARPVGIALGGLARTIAVR